MSENSPAAALVTEIRCDPDVSFCARYLEVDRAWIAEHVVIGMAGGKAHSAPTLLSDLLKHPSAAGFIKTISGVAAQASSALKRGRAKDLAHAVNAYRETFSRWHPRFVSDEVQQMIDCSGSRTGICSPCDNGYDPNEEATTKAFSALPRPRVGGSCD